MRTKIIAPIIAFIGLGSLVVLGSSPEFVGNFLESALSSPTAKVFLLDDKDESKKTILINNGKLPNADIPEYENIKVPPISKNNEDKADVPDEIVYFILFNHLVGLKGQAEKVAAKGETLDYFKLYEDQANLDSSQSQFLFQTAQDCMDATRQIDQQAKEIITKARAKFSSGEVKSPEDIPPPPTELNELQKQKNDVVLQFRDVLREGLGTQKFNKFNEFARQKIAPEVKMNLGNQEDK